MVTGLVLQWVEPLAMFDLPVSSCPAVSPVDALRPILWWIEVAVSISRKQRHAHRHSDWVSQVWTPLMRSTWYDETIMQQSSGKPVQHHTASQGGRGHLATNSFSSC
jgi:hypothetical protein